MNRRVPPQPHIPVDELDEIEAALRALTRRVNELRITRANDENAQPFPEEGTRVQILIPGVGPVEGTVIGRTRHRVKIRVPGRRGYYQRAPQNVQIL